MQTWSSSLGEIKMDLSSGLGRPTHLPSHHGLFMTVVLQVFVPVTAAGQRGLFTPLPHIHLFCLFTAVQIIKTFPSCQEIKLGATNPSVGRVVFIVSDGQRFNAGDGSNGFFGYEHIAFGDPDADTIELKQSADCLLIFQ